MQLDALRTVQILLALASVALGNPLIIDPLAAPRVTISFKGKTAQPSFFAVPVLDSK